MNTAIRIATVVGVAVVTATTATVACSNSTPNHRAGGPAGSVPRTSSVLPPGVRQNAGPTDVPNIVELRKDVVMTACLQTKAGWSAGGSIDNHHGKHDYLITVYFVTPGGTVINHAETTVPVKGGGTAKWDARSVFVAAPATRCVLRGVA